MAYFDSPKNQAIWKIELASLRKEREERAKGNYKPQKTVQTARQADGAHRRQISFAELSRQEGEAARTAGKRKDRERVPPSKSRGMER